MCCSFFFFNDTATTYIYTYLHPRSLPDSLPIPRRLIRAQVHHSVCVCESLVEITRTAQVGNPARAQLRCRPHKVQRQHLVIVGQQLLDDALSQPPAPDRKSTRLNSSY